ncbi:MAG: TonB-dependent receptor [Gammaproteobacteria bacterium HGW-Gammaproteobacteria-8]|nr:MAG: TonB-dependent receptor [Gammaproteobacteria bacterium HGW-Gammaproteobacteria-8]
MRFAKSCLPALCLLLAAVSAAQEPPPVELEPIEIEATRSALELAEVPAAVTVINGESLRQGRGAASLAEVLDQVPGLFIQNSGNFAQDARIALRGFGAQAAFGIRGVAILVDGIPQTLPDGQAQVDAIDLNEVERIEILRGPASALYGNAAGGVILITTRRAAEGPRLSARQSFGSFGRSDSRASAAVGGDQLGLRLSLGRFEQDGFRDHSRVEQKRANLRLDWMPQPATRVDMSLGWFDAPEEQDPGALNAADAAATPRAANPANVRFDAGESLEQWRFGARVEQRLSERQRLRLAGFLFDRDFSNLLPFRDGGQVTFDRQFSGLDLAHEVDLDLAGLPLRWAWGADWRLQDDDRARYGNLDGLRGDRVLQQRERVEARALWAQARLELSTAWSLTTALRQDWIDLDVRDRLLADGDDSGSRDWSELSPWIGLAWRPDSNWTVFANYGHAFQTPTTTELANPENPADGGGFNRALGPETADNLELGFRYHAPGRLRFEGSVFRIEVDDAIASFEVPEFSGSGRDFFTNAGRSTRRGLELAAEWRLGANLSLDAAWTGSDFEFDRFETADGDFSGKRLPGVPKHRSNLGLAWADARGFSARLEANRVGGFHADNANTARAESRTELRLSAGRAFRLGSTRLRLDAGIENLLDQRYPDNVRINAFGGRFFEPAPDRNYWLALGLDWR